FSVVSPGFLKEKGIQAPDDVFQNEAETVVFLLSGDQLLGYLALADEIREESYEAVKALKDRGLKVMMATGDNEKVARAVAEELGLDDHYAEVLPEDKQQIIK
ncbi:HAD-IC family P-type ATPase, partial [Arthrospira platensis SPKY1]|nr:HAD-IC family P-type ATPase [Arthrospira platensis SPKY1]